MHYTLPEILAEIRAAAARYSIDANLAIEQIRRESNFNPQAVSPAGALGLAQFIPSTGKEFGLLKSEDFFSVKKSLDAWGRYMRQLLDRYKGNVSLALAAYNAGPTAVDKAGPGIPDFKETKSYVASILARVGKSVQSDVLVQFPFILILSAVAYAIYKGFIHG